MGWKDILFPRICPVCMDIVRPRGEKICVECLGSLEYIEEPCCKKCGKAVLLEEEEYCKACMDSPPVFTAGRSLFPYRSVMGSALVQLKYHGKREFAEFFAEQAAGRLREFIDDCNPEVIIPVPIHRFRRWKRGFNQAEDIAAALGKCLALPVDQKRLFRTRNTKPQKDLKKTERFRNLYGAFAVKQDKKQPPKRILLVDDIYTTGSTLNACAKVLKEHGTKEVYFVTICSGNVH